ncbi:MAG: nuclear transport factor 2 family protein [Chthoniobacter sp.]|nr:nuclear transport factor 2 family protein [Chthoniobacter sp.]
MHSFRAFLFALLLLAPGSLRAADEPLAALRAADDQRVAATLAADRTRLDVSLSDELRYAHSSGNVDTKASLIEALTAGRLKYLALDYQERNFTFPAPGIALMSGRLHMKVTNPAGTNEFDMSYLAVWREEKGQWRFLAWQSARLPAAVSPSGGGVQAQRLGPGDSR